MQLLEVKSAVLLHLHAEQGCLADRITVELQELEFPVLAAIVRRATRADYLDRALAGAHGCDVEILHIPVVGVASVDIQLSCVECRPVTSDPYIGYPVNGRSARLRFRIRARLGIGTRRGADSPRESLN